MLELTSTSRTLTPPVIIAALTSLGEEGGKVLLPEILVAVASASIFECSRSCVLA